MFCFEGATWVSFISIYHFLITAYPTPWQRKSNLKQLWLTVVMLHCECYLIGSIMRMSPSEYHVLDSKDCSPTNNLMSLGKCFNIFAQLNSTCVENTKPRNFIIASCNTGKKRTGLKWLMNNITIRNGDSFSNAHTKCSVYNA